jgi:hypothetical protein
VWSAFSASQPCPKNGTHPRKMALIHVISQIHELYRGDTRVPYPWKRKVQGEAGETRAFSETKSVRGDQARDYSSIADQIAALVSLFAWGGPAIIIRYN